MLQTFCTKFIYDKNSIIECELIVYGLDYICMHDKCMLKYIFFSSKIILFLVSSPLLHIFVIILS